jgi:hypothetical protein
VTAAIGRALARRRRSTWAAAGLLALSACACSGTRRLVLFERDAGRPPGEAGTQPPDDVDAGSPPPGAADAGRQPLDSGAPAVDAGCALCPTRIVLDGGSPGELHGGDGGFAHMDLCPDDQALIGYLGALQDIGTRTQPLHAVGSLQGLCGALELGSDGALRVASSAALPVRGDADAPRQLNEFEQRCPADQVVVGVEGRAGLALDRVAFVCAGMRAASGDGGTAFARENAAELSAAGGDGGSAFSARCPPGSLARGHHVRAGRWIDAIAPVCAAPLLAP